MVSYSGAEKRLPTHGTQKEPGWQKDLPHGGKKITSFAYLRAILCYHRKRPREKRASEWKGQIICEQEVQKCAKGKNMDKTSRLEVPWKPGFSKRATSRSGEEGCTKWSPHSLMNFFSKSIWYKRHGYMWADMESQQENRKDYATFQMLSGLKPTQSSTPLEALVKQQ